MKRSEALKKIRDYNNVLDPYDDREFEEQILTFIEDVIGMLPPPVGIGEEDEWGHLDYEFKWEPEDEKK